MINYSGYRTDYGVNAVGQDHDYHVRIQFAKDVYDIDGRVAELREINEWIEELVEWQPNMYTLRVHSSGRIIDVWFLKEQHATWFALRWL